MPQPVVFPFKATGQKDVENAFKSIASAAEKSSKTVTKEVDQQGKALDKLAKQVSKTAKAIEKERVEASKKATDQILQDYEKQAKAAEKLGERLDKAFEKHNKRSAVGTIGKIGGLAKNAALAAGAAAVAGVAVAAREAVQLDEIANRIAISARGAGQKQVDHTALRKSFEATAIATPGIKSEEIAAGTAAFVSKTGRLDIAQQMQGTFATAASASGSSVEEIATAAADLFEKFDIKTIDDMQSAFAKLIFQGKEGSFELKDAASQFAKLSAAAASFNIGKGSVAVATLGGLTQIAKRATGSPEQAATAVESMFSHLTANATKLKGQGVNVFNKDGTSRNIQDILVDTITKVGKGDLAKKKAGLQATFGEQGIRAINPLIQTFEEAFIGAKKEGKTEKEALSIAQQALRAEFDKTINAAGSWAEVQKDAASAQKTASAELNASWEAIKSGVANTAVPAINTLAKGLVTAFEKLGIINKAELTPQEKVESAQKELDKFNQQMGANVPSEDELTQKAQLEDTLAKATAEARPLEEKFKESSDRMTKEQFIASYGENKSWFGPSSGEDIVDVMSKGKLPNDWLLEGNETDSQKELRTKYQQQAAYEDISGIKGQREEKEAKDAAEIKAAADAQKQAADDLKQAAIELKNAAGYRGQGPLSHID